MTPKERLPLPSGADISKPDFVDEAGPLEITSEAQPGEEQGILGEVTLFDQTLTAVVEVVEEVQPPEVAEGTTLADLANPQEE